MISPYLAGVVHHEDPSLLTQMIKLIADYIGLLNAHQSTKLNRVFSSSGHISFMTWVAEGIINQDQPWQNWKPRWPGQNNIHWLNRNCF